MKKVFVAILVLISLGSFAQGTPDSLKHWKKGGLGALNFSQSSFSNWAAGGENALSITTLFNLFANYQNGKTSWENNLDLAYGFLKTGDESMRKNDDKIDFTSKLGYKTSKNWALATQVNFKSQFTAGYNYPDDSTVISNLLAPAYILVSMGADYKIKDYFSFFVSPVTGKITIVNDQTLADAGAYGVEKAIYDSAGTLIQSGKKTRFEFGALISAKFKKEIIKNVTLDTKLNLFSNYLNNPQNIDVNWDFLINMKVNKFISTSISTTLIYDHDIPIPIYHTINGVRTQVGTGPRTQFKEVLAIGFSYKF